MKKYRTVGEVDMAKTKYSSDFVAGSIMVPYSFLLLVLRHNDLLTNHLYYVCIHELSVTRHSIGFKVTLSDSRFRTQKSESPVF